MREKLFRKLKQNKAFTLMEMMIVTALIIALLGISVIAISNWSKSLKMTELDNYAKSVYLEAQNQLAAMEAEGSLSKLYKDFTEEDGQYYESYGDRKLTAPPADYSVEVYGDFYKGIYYFTNADDVTTLFVPEISLSGENGNYLIEVNPATGDVYSVFYWETSNDYLTGENATAIYAQIKAMEAKGGANNRTLESRKEYEVGYYGGTGGDTVATSSYKLNQEVRIVNGEELYIEISYDLNDRVIQQIGEVTDQFDIEITIVGETSGEKWTPEFELRDNFIEDTANGRLITGFLLDGLGAEQSFESIVSAAGKAFIPGEDLKVSVKTIYQHEGIVLKEQSSTHHANSLFHDVTDRYVENGDTQIVERTIGVSAVRHLRNLGETYYSGDIVTAVDGKEIESYVIIQRNDIDFDKGTYTYSSSRPISSIAPIRNAAIFMEGSKNVLINGNDFIIKNLVVASNENNAGLFAETNQVTFKNVKLEDYTLNAPDSQNVGGLVGYAIGGKIEYSGVYLAPSYRDANGIKRYYNQDRDSTYGNVMARHYATMMVTGGTNVGGLVGYADKTAITDSFGGVQVKGVNTVGGLVGFINGRIAPGVSTQTINTNAEVAAVVSIQKSYASGDVYASNMKAGGLIGASANLCIEDAYATGNVFSNSEMAGFVGNSQHGYYRRCYSYGEVLSWAGNDAYNRSAIVGGFYANAADNHGDASTLGYLSQVGYNSQDTILVDSALKKEYKDFTDMVTKSSAASSHPYDGNLLFKAFPFQMVTDNHYGDWPIQYFINTSLVYYEKYADGSYGYYSVTKLTDTAELNSDVNKYVWVLDSLRDDIECREDGYALLSMFYLDSVDYSVYQYSDKTNDNVKNPIWQLAQKGESDSTQIKGTLTITENEYGSDKMVRLVQQGALVFNAYEEVENPYSASYKNKDIKSSFVTNGMYLYQLPYELQNTYRYDVDNFYDVIVFDEGYAVGNLKGEDGEVGGTPVISNEVYYYCPHFPRLAINPGLGVSESTTNFVQLEAPYTVAVRTARQLNNLGRVPYYWNDKGGGTDLITYNQELDINFSTYADFGSGKKYCGKTYNLLAFDTEYANQPIGQNAQLSTGYGAFQNDYNGNYHKIIDYCVKSSNQYVGLFGEIYKDGGATKAQISNVVMETSNPDFVPTYVRDNYTSGATAEALQNNAGLIIGSFTDTSNVSNANRPRVGVGALVGSDYTIGVTDGEAKIFTIYNCASTGFKVEYLLKNESNGRLPLGIAMGGMVGYTRGNLAQSSADNYVKLVARGNMTGDKAAVLLGGFTGSCYYGTTLNCYSGGTIDVDDVDQNGTVYYVNRLRIGGFCPGWLDAPGVENNMNSEIIRYQNVYSYTEVSPNVWEVREDASNSKVFNHYFPSVSRMYVSYNNSSGKWDTKSQNGSSTGVRVPGFSYYYETRTYDSDVMNHISDEAKEYFTYSGTNRPKTCDPATYFQMTQFNWLNSNESSGGNVKFISTQWYPSLQKANNGYPFPAYVTDANGAYTHYGAWPEVVPDPIEGLPPLAGAGFEISYDHDNWGNTPDTDPCNFYQLADGTYYAEFSFASDEIADGLTIDRELYTRCPIPGLKNSSGRQMYLTFSSNGTCGVRESSSATVISDGLNADTVYSLYIYGVDLDKPYNQQNITWKLIKK